MILNMYLSDNRHLFIIIKLLYTMFLNLSGKTFCLSKQEPFLQQITDLLSNHHTTIDNFSFYSNGKLLQSLNNL
jgi:hypothetical protein